MKLRNLSLIVALAALVMTAGAAFAANGVSVETNAAQDGTFGLELTTDGSTNATFVRDNTPDAETVYRASFWVDRDGIGTANPDGGLFLDSCGGTCSTRFVMFRAGDQFHNGGGSDVTALRIIMTRLAVDGGDGPRYALRLGVRNDFGGFVFIGAPLLTNTATRKWVTIEWQAASGPASADGVARVYQGNAVGVTTLLGESTTIQNFTHNIDYVQLGAVSGLADQASDANTRGVTYFDSFESYRTMLP